MENLKLNYEKYPECIEKGRQNCRDKGIILPVNGAGGALKNKN